MSTALAMPAPEAGALAYRDLIDRAIQKLEDARSSAEVMETMSLAQALAHHAKVTRADNESRADCLRLLVRARIRMADEVDRAQEEGELATSADGYKFVHGVSFPNGKETPAPVTSLGVTYKQIHEWRKFRDAGLDAAEAAIERALAEDRTPTLVDILREARGYWKTTGSDDNEWYTPAEYIERARRVLGEIDLDPASSDQAQDRVRAGSYFTQDLDGLGAAWHGRVWLNPPYSQPLISEFVGKLVSEYGSGNVTQAILLTHNNTDTSWFHEAAGAADAICFTRRRIKFEKPGDNRVSPPCGQAFFYLGEDMRRFDEEFGDVGLMMEPTR